MRLRLFREADLVTVGPWFDDVETRRWLGGREWPAALLRLARDLPGRQGFLALLDGGEPACLIDLEVEADGTASFAIVTDPARRGRGHARACFEAMLEHADLSGVSRFEIGVETGNAASRRLASAIGLSSRGPADSDGFETFGGPITRPAPNRERDKN